MKIHSFNVQPHLPENINFLEELANDMWFTWNWQAILLFVQVDEKLWTAAKRNPKWFLGSVPQKRFEELSKDENFVQLVNKVKESYYNYKNNPHTWYHDHKHENGQLLTAYFSMEYGIGEGLPIYSGGLGMLAGDHIKSASDLGMPIIGVGLFYKQGYVQQVLNREGWQNEEYPDNDWAHMPVERVQDKNGKDIVVDIPLGGENVKACIWRVPVGRTSLYLLDTNLQENTPAQRAITEKLYGGDRENRIRQEVVLGIGGVKEFSRLNESYDEALQAILSANGRVAHADDLDLRCDYEENYPVETENRIFEMVEKGDYVGAGNAARQYFDWMVENFPDGLMDIRLKVLEFVLYAERLLCIKGGNTYEFKSRTDYLPTVMGMEDTDDIKDWFLKKIVEVTQKVENNRSEKSESLIEKAEAFINRNYMKDISLDDISRYCNISSYYFSKLFKQETGENYVEYLSRVRIENAKKMLSESEASVKEISFSVGFSDPNYFSRAFKKYEGVSPTEYKDAL